MRKLDMHENTQEANHMTHIHHPYTAKVRGSDHTVTQCKFDRLPDAVEYCQTMLNQPKWTSATISYASVPGNRPSPIWSQRSKRPHARAS